jgi:mannose-6-phosphate isomerase-like protein (cupin superfamily)
MKGYIANIEDLVSENANFRKVVYTAKNTQLVLMNLLPKEDIGEEIHDVDQFFRFEKGQGRVVIDGVEHDIADGFAVIVPAGAKHNVINTSESESLKLYTLYCPPHHEDRVLHKTKSDALSDSEHFDGKTTE